MCTMVEGGLWVVAWKRFCLAAVRVVISLVKGCRLYLSDCWNEAGGFWSKDIVDFVTVGRNLGSWQ